MWPISAHTPTSVATLTATPSACARIMGKAALLASPNSVKKAAFLPPYLRTFVAPGFPDPISRGSEMPMSLLIKIAEDIEPIK